jgi:DNA-binding CsgD family transcriptional regulator
VPSIAVAALLERERELGTVRDGLDQACAGDGTLLLIEGPAGAGKTELVREARATAGQRGMAILEARGSELEQPFAFGAVRQLLEPVIDGSTGLFAGAAGPAARLFEPDERESPAADGGFEALHSLYWLMVNLADRSPVLVLVDDCHWLDRDSLRFLSYLAQRIEGLPVTMVLAARPLDSTVAEPDSAWAQVASRPQAVVVHPRPLSEPAATALVRKRLGPEAADEFCRACHQATGGNPLFLQELLMALEAAGVAPSAATAGEVQAVGPGAVSRFVLHRLARLGRPASELARAVAVLGDDSDLLIAGRVAGLPDTTARTAADDLVRAEIFVSAERLGFVHPIVRAALYEDLAPGERQAQHAAAADALATAGASAERVTVHLLLTAPTGDQNRVKTLRAAAISAARRGAPAIAAARLRRALAESPGEEERAEIGAELGRYEVAAMEFEAAEQHLRLALESNASIATRADAASTLGRCAIVSGGQGAATATEALTALAHELRPTDPERSLELGAEQLALISTVLDLRRGLDLELERFREQARGHPGFEAVARIHGAMAHMLQGESASEGVAEIQAAFATGLPPSARTNAAFFALIALRYAERYDLASPVLEHALEGARQEGHATRQGLIHGQRALIAVEQGALHDAQVEAETGLLLVEEPHFAVLQLLAAAIVVDIERGSLDTATALRRRGDKLGVADDRPFVTDYLSARGRLRIAQGDIRGGVEDLLWLGQRIEAIGLRWPSDWGAFAAPALASLGEHEQAARLADEQLAEARRFGTPGGLGRSLRAVALTRQAEERIALLEEAISVLESSSARLELAYALADLGRELSRANRRREGRDAQRRAMALAEHCGALVLARRAMDDLRSGPGRRARIELTGPSALTAAEWRVCRQAVAGRTNREIAETLFVTEKTVERHLSSAYHKLGIRSRFQLQEAIGEPSTPA